MKVMVNVEKRHAFVIMGLLVLGVGIFVVNALTAGETPNPGHNIQSVGPPSWCESGQVLRFIDGSWDCVSVGADGYNPDNQPTASVRGEPTRSEIESWGDKYDTDTIKRCFTGRKCLSDGAQISASAWASNHLCNGYAKVFGDEVKVRAVRSNYHLPYDTGWVSAYSVKTNYPVCTSGIDYFGVTIVSSSSGITKTANW